MADATRRRTIYQIQQILKAYKAKLEEASTYRDFLSAEGKSLTDDYIEENSETKSLIEKAVSEPSFFLNMENDNLIRYSDVCIKLNKLLKLKVHDVERIKKIVNDNFFITSDAQRITSFAEVELGRIVTYNVGEEERIDANNILNKGLYDVEWEVEDVGGNFYENIGEEDWRYLDIIQVADQKITAVIGNYFLVLNEKKDHTYKIDKIINLHPYGMSYYYSEESTMFYPSKDGEKYLIYNECRYNSKEQTINAKDDKELKSIVIDLKKDEVTYRKGNHLENLKNATDKNVRSIIKTIVPNYKEAKIN